MPTPCLSRARDAARIASAFARPCCALSARAGGFVAVVRDGHVVDHLLVHGRERDVRRDRCLFGRFDARRAAAEIEQQPLQRQRRNRAVHGGVARRIAEDRRRRAVVRLVRAHCRRGQARQIGGLGEADRERRVARVVPGDAGQRVRRFGEIDQLGQRVRVRGIERGRRRHRRERRRRRQRVVVRTLRGCARWRRHDVARGRRLRLPRAVGRRRRQIDRRRRAAGQRDGGRERGGGDRGGRWFRYAHEGQAPSVWLDGRRRRSARAACRSGSAARRARGRWGRRRSTVAPGQACGASFRRRPGQ